MGSKSTTTIERRCHWCESGRIKTGISMGLSGELGAIGLKFIGLTFKGGQGLTETEPLFADLCLDCGTVVRTFVKNPDEDWL